MRDALAAVLAEVEREDVDAIVLGGDIAAGPQPRETLALLEPLGDRLLWLRGNSERWLNPGERGDTPDGLSWWSSTQLDEDQVSFLVALPPTQELEIDGLGTVLFCHAVPQNDMTIITPATPDEYVRKAAEGVEADVIVAGHTHVQFDKRLDGVRWVNAGSVGMPYEGEVAAYWALLGPDVELRHTAFDRERAAEGILASGWPEAEAFVRENVRAAVSRDEAIPFFEQQAVDRGER
jgi:predicted phosphodiesterase